MLLLIAVLAFVSAAFLLFRYVKRQNPKLSNSNTISIDPPRGARPLFAPDEDELRLEAERDAAREIARREYRAKAAARDEIDRALAAWRSSPDRQNTVELLRVTADAGHEGDLVRAAGEIVEAFTKNRVVGITNEELADLLDGHLRLLSGVERASGTMFWLKQEVAKLRVRQ